MHQSLTGIATTCVFPSTGETRFGTNFYMLERMEKVKTELELTVTDREWTAWLNNNQKYQGTAKEVRGLGFCPSSWVWGVQLWPYSVCALSEFRFASLSVAGLQLSH